MAWQSTTSC